MRKSLLYLRQVYVSKMSDIFSPSVHCTVTLSVARNCDCDCQYRASRSFTELTRLYEYHCNSERKNRFERRSFGFLGRFEWASFRSKGARPAAHVPKYRRITKKQTAYKFQHLCLRNLDTSCYMFFLLYEYNLLQILRFRDSLW